MDTPPIRVVRDAVTRAELATLAERQFGNMVKAVVDVARGVMAIGGELHAVRPAQGNRSRDVEDVGLRSVIRGVVSRLVTAA